MVKEEKNIDFYTTGRQPSEQEFAKISELIKNKKEKKESPSTRAGRKGSTSQRTVAASETAAAGIRKSN
jgi:hypothetical protein